MKYTKQVRCPMWNTKIIVSMFAVFGLGILLNPSVFAATYYVRTDGGTPTQCTGTSNAAYPGSGTAQACALSHPAWALGVIGAQKGLMSGGDTLIIDDTDHVTNGQAQYKIGYGMANSVSPNCYIGWTYDCVMLPVPSGIDAAHPTKIVGIGYNSSCTKKPQLWGTDGVNQIFNLSKASNVNMECLELTDHSNCGLRVGNPICAENWNISQLSGPYGKVGVYAQTGSNFSFVNMDVHGFANRGFLMGGVNGIILSYVNMDGNYMANWDGDVGTSNNVSYNSGTIIMDHVKNRFAGCSEAYPRSASFNTADYSNCTDQNDGGYGDGLGMYRTGGNWVITNSEFSHNASDGLDLLYHDGTGSVTIQRSLFEGNTGNQIKVASANVNIENSIVIGNCSYITSSGKAKNSSFVGCRAGGDAIVYSIFQGGSYKLFNSSVYSSGNSHLLIANNSNTCDGTEKYLFRNNIYLGNGYSSLYINLAGGVCSNVPLDTDYSIVNNVSGGFCPSGSHNKCSTDPKWVGAINQTADSNLSNIALQSTSPAIGSALNISGVSSLDYNGVDRGTTWDMAALQNGSVPTTTTTTTTPTTTTDTSTTSTTTTSTTTTTTPSPTSATTPLADTTAPSIPTGLWASAASMSQINVSWGAASDDTGVAGYKVFRNGAQVGTTASTSYLDAGLTASTAYSYKISAYDAAGNNSAQSSSVSATTSSDTTLTTSTTPSPIILKNGKIKYSRRYLY